MGFFELELFKDAQALHDKLGCSEPFSGKEIQIVQPANPPPPLSLHPTMKNESFKQLANLGTFYGPHFRVRNFEHLETRPPANLTQCYNNGSENGR